MKQIEVAPAPRTETPVPCAAATTDADAHVHRDRWTFKAYVSDTAGLVVDQLAFGPRLVADQLSVPYVRAVPGGSNTQQPGLVGHLSPNPRPEDGDLTSTLAGPPVCNPSGHPGVRATYLLHSASLNANFVLEQDYRFDAFDPDTRCEASQTAQCLRFWPTVTWARLGSPDQAAGGLDVVQRFDFDPDQLSTSSVDVTRDVPDVINRHGPGIDSLSANGALMQSGEIVALDKGHILKWENFHLSARSMVSLPGTPNFHGLGGSGYAGCSDCIHAHWSWFHTAGAAAQLVACQSTTCWTRSKPQVLTGSDQTACLAWRPASTTTDVADWCARARGSDPAEQGMPPGGLASLYWESRSNGATSPDQGVSIGGKDYAVGDALWPQLPAGDSTTGSFKGDTGAMFVVPARRLVTTYGGDDSPGSVVIEMGAPQRNDRAGSRLPVGWVVPITIRLAAPGDVGPYYLRVHSSTLKLLNPAPEFDPTSPQDPWVDIYDDGPTPDPASTAPRVLSYQGEPLHAFLVFDHLPTREDVLSFELDAAPDGVQYYIPAAQSVSRASAFQTPSGNIQCMSQGELEAASISGPVLTPIKPRSQDLVCRILDADWSAGQCRGSEPGRVLHIYGGQAAVSPCQGDIFTTFPGQGYPGTKDSDLYRAQYGDHIDLGRISCDVSEDGVRCQDGESRHGFTVARAAFREF